MEPGAARLTSAEQVKFRKRLPKSKTVKRSILMSFHLSRQHLHRSVLQLPAAFTTSSLAAGTPFVSRFCTPNPTHTLPRPPPLVPKMPLGPGQICSPSVFEDRPSVKCVRVMVVVVGVVSSLLSRSTSIYTQLDCLRC